MIKPELTGEQIKELQKNYRYVRFVHDQSDPSTYILQTTKAIVRGKETVWESIQVPEIKGKSRSTIRFYALQIIDLQAY